MQAGSCEDEVSKEIMALMGLMDGQDFDVISEELSTIPERPGYRLRVKIH